MNKLFKIELPSDYQAKLAILAGIFVGLGVISAVVGAASKLAGGGKLNASPILALMVMLYVTVLSLDKLFKMELPSDYQAKLAILAGIFGGLSVVIIAIGAASKLASGGLKATGTILAMCVFIGVAIGALMVLSIFPAEALIKGAVSFGILLLALGGALAGAGQITTQDTWKSVLAMAVTVGAITVALGVLSMVPWEKLLKAGIALGAMLLALATDLYAAGKISNDKAWLPILAMVAAVVAIGLSLSQLAQHPWDQLLAASVSMSLVLFTFGEVLEGISSRSGIKTEKIVLFLTATLAVIPITWALSELAQQPWSGLLTAAVSMSAVLLVFGELLKAISSRSGIKTEKIVLFLTATLAVIPIGTALYVLSEQPWQRLLAAGVALSATVLAFSGAFVIISSSKPDEMAIVAFLAATLAIIPIAWALNELAQHPWDSLLSAASSISMVLLALTACLAILAAVGANVQVAAEAALALDAFILILGAVMLGLGALFQNIKSLEGYLDKGIEVLVKIGEGLGRFAGSIVSGVIQEISNSLPVIGKNLSDFMDAGKTFFDGIKKVDAETVKSVGFLAAAVGVLTATSILDGLTSWLTGGSSMVKFGQELSEFAPYFASYASAISGIDSATVEASSKAALSLAEMASKLPNSGGLAAKIFGDNSLSEFGQELKKFGPYLASYANTIKDIDPAVVEASANAAQVMSDMASKLPNSGGLAAKILGDNTLSSFGQELKKFGPLLAAYADSISGLDAGVVTNSANAAKSLSELANNLPNSGGLISWFTGDNDIGSFGKSLVKFGEGMKSYYDSISGIQISVLDGVIQEVKKLIEIAQGTASLDTSGMTRFASSLQTMGMNGIDGFISAFKNSTSQVTNAVSEMLTAVINSVNAQNDKLTNLGTNSANRYLLGIKNKYAEATLTGTMIATKIITALQTQVPNFLTKGTLSATQYLTGIKNKYGEATSTGTMLASKVVSGLQSQVSNFLTQGTTSADRFLQGFRNKYGDASSVGTTLANNAVSGIKSVDFNQAGVDAGKGFANGLNSTSDLARTAGRSIGNAAYEAAKNALQEKSPSKKMYEVGEFAGLGLVNALMYMVAKVANAGEELGNATVDSVSDVISGISQVISDDMIADPVIRPFVDLTGVEEGISTINSMFNDAITISAFNVDSVSNAVSKEKRVKTSGEIQNEEVPNTTNYFNFNQNNYSPEPLSRSEIYRQTRNLFSTWKGTVNAI